MAHVNKNDFILNIRGIDVHFPYQPYDVQKIYMEKVIESLQTVKRKKSHWIYFYIFICCF